MRGRGRSTRSPAPAALGALVLLAAVAVPSCGGSRGATTPDPPTPTPTPTPAPSPTPEPTPQTSCRPLPPPVSRINVKIHMKNKDYWTLDATPLVGPDALYCQTIGFTDGRQFCAVRPEGDPKRAECEAYAVGRAADTGRIGPTWNRQGQPCTGRESLCENSPHNQYQLWIYKGGLYEACAENGACGSVDADKDL